MATNYLRCAGLLAGALLLCAPAVPVRAQDANRDVVATKSDIGTVVDRIERSSGQFKEEFDNAVNHSTMDDSHMEAAAKRRADELHDASKKLGDVFHDKKDKNNPAVRDQADKTLASASELNRVMLSHRFTDKVQRDWFLLRSDLNALAKMYDLRPLEGESGNQ
jgi:spermidine/putrescine-binding protein